MTAPPAVGHPPVDDFDTEARRALAASVRALTSAVLTAEQVDDAVLLTAAATLDGLTARLYEAEPNPGVRDRHVASHDAYLCRSPIVGRVNPIAPPIEYRVVGSRVVADLELGAPYEGPPGYVHGGVVSLIFDELLGIVNLVDEHPRMTAVLTVKYRRPTPLFRPLLAEAWVERVEGRKAITRARISHDGVTTADAEGLFVTPGMEKVLEYFGPSEETPDPLP